MSITKPPESLEMTNAIIEHVPYTQKNMIEFSYTWTIENFLSTKLKIGEPLHSPAFSSSPNTSHQWRLILYPEGRDHQNKDYVAIFLWLCGSGEIEVKAFFEISILNSQECKDWVIPVSNGMLTFSEKSGQPYNGCIRYVLREYLKTNAKTLMPNQNLTIVCDIKMIENNTTNRLTDLFDTKTFKAPDCQLNNDIAKLFKNPQFSDITIVIGDREIPAHKTILAARSPVFATMVEIKSKTQHRMNVADTEYEVFIEILRYVYRGKVENIEKLANRLLVSAHMYDLKRLKAQCEIALTKNICVGNAGPLLVIADFCKADYLKQRVVAFISTHTLELKDDTSFFNTVKGQPGLLLDAFDILAKRVTALSPDTSSRALRGPVHHGRSTPIVDNGATAS